MPRALQSIISLAGIGARFKSVNDSLEAGEDAQAIFRAFLSVYGLQAWTNEYADDFMEFMDEFYGESPYNKRPNETSVEKVAEQIFNAERIDKALQTDPAHTAPSFLTQEELARGNIYAITGGDGATYTLLQVELHMSAN